VKSCTSTPCSARALTAARQIAQAGRFGHLARRVTVVYPRAERRISAGLQQQLDGRAIAFGDRHVERRVVVDAALVRIGAALEEQREDLEHVRPRLRAGAIVGAGQRGDQRRKAVVDGRTRIGAGVEQRPDESHLAVIDRVDETRPDRQRHRTIRDGGGIVDGGAKRRQIAARKASSIFLNFAASAHRSSSDFMTRRARPLSSQARRGRRRDPARCFPRIPARRSPAG